MRRVLAACLVLLPVFALLSPTPAAAVEPGTDVFSRTWARTDQPVVANQATRTWMWGPSAFTSAMTEEYDDSPNGTRIVQYYDKARMEITNPSGDPSSIWYVTNGLLVVELVTGRMQFGDNSFEELWPAEINVAGDANDPNGPTYASFNSVLDAPPVPDGTLIPMQIHRDGSISNFPAAPDYGVTSAIIDDVTNHAIATPFWEFMNSSATVFENGSYVEANMFENPYFATGRPISEAYWAPVQVAGTVKDVLVQCFERRCLTYTPDNPPGWQVEAGNVGQHYYQWRYLADIPSEPPAVESADYVPLGPVFLPDWPIGFDGLAELSIGNQAPYDMVVQLDGPESHQFTVPACPDCPIYSSPSQVTTCREDLDWHDLIIPPGNYRMQVSWPGSNTSMLAGPATFVPDSYYGSCYFIYEQLQ